MIRRLDSTDEIMERFISPMHYNGLVEYMKQAGLIVAFRPAGRFSIDKMQLGAAPKPHCILDKTIKPCEVGLTEEEAVLFAQAPAMAINDRTKVKQLLCGLVGRRAGGSINGLYLTPEGSSYFSRFLEVQEILEDNRYSYVTFESFLMLLDVLGDMFANEEAGDYSKFRYFVTGDYDLHEILQTWENGDVTHLVADQLQELEILCRLSDAAMKDVANRGGDQAHMAQTADGRRFVSEIYSPIQHGAQDNFVEHMFNQEPDTRIVDKVAAPALDIAFYNGRMDFWTVIENDITESVKTLESKLIQAIVNQGREIAQYLEDFGIEPAPWWNIDNDRGLAALVNTFGKTYEEWLWSYMD